MARAPRLHVPGGLYHVMLRGNAGQRIFFDDADRYRLYLFLQEGVQRHGHRIHAFCCMTNHIHLAIQVAKTPLAKILQNIAFRYTRHINRKKRRTGHLFQGRYQAILVDAESYLLELVRYIHLNPVRAHLVKRPEAYRWSGHRAYLRREELPWLTTDWVLTQFAAQRAVARRRYARFVAEGLGEGHREDFHRGGEDTRVLGEDKFLERVLNARESERKAKRMSLPLVIKRVCTAYQISEQELCGPSRHRRLAEARGATAWLALERGSATLAQVAHYLGRDPSAMTHALRRLETRRRQSRGFDAKLKAMCKTK